MQHLDALKETLPETARDIKINVGNVFTSETLSRDQIWGTALASAYFIGTLELRDAIIADAQEAGVGVALFEDAQAAASLMGMNTIYYRFRHLSGKPVYSQKPARLRMQWMARPKTNKADYELFSLAIAALAGCESCIKAHEDSVLKGGLTEDHVVDAVRLASVLQGFAVSLRL